MVLGLAMERGLQQRVWSEGSGVLEEGSLLDHVVGAQHVQRKELPRWLLRYDCSGGGCAAWSRETLRNRTI
jgi:hypothetical protein